MGKQRNHTQEQREYMSHHNCCELCGAYKRLELHHIIPIACGGSDRIDNWIAICPTCHAKLTPRSELTKIGMSKLKERNKICSFALDVYQRWNDDDTTRACEMVDIFTEVFEEYLNLS